MKKRSPVHVVASAITGVWRVRQGGRTLSRHRTQKTAMSIGRRRARHDRVDLVTHDRDGRIRSKDSYRNESPALDREH
jgi:hypothetical protein